MIKLSKLVLLCSALSILITGTPLKAQPNEINNTASGGSNIVNGNNNNVRKTYNTFNSKTVIINDVERLYEEVNQPSSRYQKSKSEHVKGSRKLMVTDAYLLPNYGFMSENPIPDGGLNDIAFLFVTVKSLSTMPILITSADFVIEGARDIFRKGGSFGNDVLSPTTGRYSILLQPGESQQIKFSGGIRFSKLSKYMDSIGIRDALLNNYFSPPHIMNTEPINKFNMLLTQKYGQASLLVSIYENDGLLVHRVRFFLSKGDDSFFHGESIEPINSVSTKGTKQHTEYVAKLQHDVFLGEYLRLLSEHDKSFKLHALVPAQNMPQHK